MATNGAVPKAGGREGGDVMSDLRALRAEFEGLDTRGSLKRDVEGKIKVMRSCVEKVEGAVYGMIIRGRERPKGWVPEMGERVQREAVEGY